MIHDGDALMRAILDDPDDDVSRLVYADWLEENGKEARAQFIRAMVEAARLAPSRELADRRRFEEVTAEYCRLLAKHEGEWLAELPRVPGVSWLASAGTAGGPIFQRGFVNNVRVDGWPVLREHGGTLFEATPIERLSLRLNGARECQEFAKWPNGRQLKALELRESELGISGLSPLVESDYLSKLRRLDLVDHSGLIRFSEVLESRFFQQLDTLRLIHAYPAPEDLLLITNNNQLFSFLQMRRLEWHSRWDLSPFLEAILRWLPPNLSWLHLQSDAGTGDEMARLIAQSPVSGQLRRLVLRGTGMTEIGAGLLAQSEYLEDLELLDVRNNPIAVRAARQLSERFDHDQCQLLIRGGGPL